MKYYIAAAATCLAMSSAQSAIVATSAQFDAVSPPVFSVTDLAQTAYLSSSGTGGNEASQHAELFNGVMGNTDGDTNDSGEVTLDSDNSITITLDTTVNTLGYDITGIDTIMGWSPVSNGRSNQGYEVVLGFVGGGTATLIASAHHEPNSPAQYWTSVRFTDDADSTLGGIATGVNSITWNIDNDAPNGGVVVAREFDVFGVATVPEPSSLALLGLGGLTLILRRKK